MPQAATVPHRRPGLVRDGRGVAAVEFALIAAPFIALLVGTLQVAVMFFMGQSLETFTETTGRSILVGAAQQAGYSQAAYKASLCAALPTPFQCQNLYVDVTTAASFSGAGTGMPQLTFDQNGNVTNNWNYNLGTQGSIVVLRLMYQWPVIGLPLGISFANQSNGSRLLLSTAVFQNERGN